MTYGKAMTLLGKVDDVIAVLDFCCPIPYVFAGAIIYGNFCSANMDLLDLNQPLPSYTWYTEAYYDDEGKVDGWTDPVDVTTDTREEFVERVMRALSEPVIVPNEDETAHTEEAALISKESDK